MTESAPVHNSDARSGSSDAPARPVVRVDFPAPAVSGRTEAEPGVGLVTIDRREALNAIDAAVLDGLLAALHELDADDRCGAIVLTGTGTRAFAAGADIRAMADQTPETIEQAGHFDRWGELRTIRLPIIAAVRGYALGGGCELAMACDIIVAGEDATFGQPEIKLGVIPGSGGTQRLPRAVGKARAMELILTGRSIGAVEAERMGLVSLVVPADQTLDRALELAGRIAAQPRLAVRAAKRAVNAAYELPLTGGLAVEQRAFFDLFASADQKEGMAAFLDKRSPNFTGADRPTERQHGDVRMTDDLEPRATPDPAASLDRASDIGSDIARDLGGEPPPAYRDAPPNRLAPIDASAPVSGHVPAAERPRTGISLRPEHDWAAAASVIMPVVRPAGSAGVRVAGFDRAALAASIATAHTMPLLAEGPCDLLVGFVLPAVGFDVVVNGEHLLSWGVEGDVVLAAALANLAAWSADANWADEVSGERRLLSSDSGTGSDAARILLPEVRTHLADVLGMPGVRILIGLPERHLLIAGRLMADDSEFATLVRDYVGEQCASADEPIDRRLFELVGTELVEFTA